MSTFQPGQLIVRQSYGCFDLAMVSTQARSGILALTGGGWCFPDSAFAWPFSEPVYNALKARPGANGEHHTRAKLEPYHEAMRRLSLEDKITVARYGDLMGTLVHAFAVMAGGPVPGDRDWGL